jgi:triosephosphate isomerase (TIM)
MQKPLIIVNFKTYVESTGENAVKLAKNCESAAKKASTAKVVIAVQAADLFRVGSVVDKNLVDVYAQHVDIAGQGKFTGYITAEAAKSAGAKGTLINHAEHKLGNSDVIAKHIAAAKRAGLTTVACAANVEEAKAIAKAEPTPDFIAIELPELIGTLVSISKVKPEVVTAAIAAVKSVKDIPLLCGAGVANGEDAGKAIKLGTKGILLATAVVLAKNPEQVMIELANSMASRPS